MRRQTDAAESGPRHPFKKLALGVFVTLFLVAGIWNWRYLVYEPVWLVRAHYADRSDLYLGKINNLSNLQLVQQARNYLSDLNRTDASGNLTSPEPFRAQGIHISTKWFERHPPDSVDFNPFEPSGQGSYSVSWRYFPGCQQTIGNSLKTRSDWFDRKGQPCSPVCLVSVFMDPNLKLTAVRLTPHT